MEFRGQIYAALIGAGLALAIAVGGFLIQSGRVNGHLDSLEYREKRVEAKIDVMAEDVVALRERTARIEEHLRHRSGQWSGDSDQSAGDRPLATAR